MNFNETWHKYSSLAWALLQRFSGAEVNE